MEFTKEQDEIYESYKDYLDLVPIAFKGFGFKEQRYYCRDDFFNETEWNRKNSNFPLIVCSEAGYHFCLSLHDVFKYYSKNVSSIRFCVIEYDKNEFKHNGDKSITRAFRILEDITEEARAITVNTDYDFKKKWKTQWIIDNKDEFDKMIESAKEVRLKEAERKAKIETLEKIKPFLKEEKEKALKEENLAIAQNLGLNHVKKLQEKYQNIYIGGSLGLFLHGMKIPRFFNTSNSDLDIVIPYFQIFESSDGLTIKHENAKASGNDFDETFILTTDYGTTKVDVKIDPKQAYEIIEFDGVKYKVTKIEKIWEAKIRYALGRNGKKHLNDLKQLMIQSSKVVLKEGTKSSNGIELFFT